MIYILHVHSGYEHQTAQLLRRTISLRKTDAHVYSLDRELRIRKGGKRHIVKQPLYSGYIFVETSLPAHELPGLIKPIQTAVRFLPSNSDCKPLTENEESFIRRFIHFGGTLPRSRVKLIPGQAIQVIDGPLQGLEGIIQRIDKRRERVKIRLEMSDRPFVFDLGIELVKEAESRVENTV